MLALFVDVSCFQPFVVCVLWGCFSVLVLSSCCSFSLHMFAVSMSSLALWHPS